MSATATATATAAAPWHLVVEFTGVDLDDDAVIDALVADPTVHIEWSSSEGVTTAEATVSAESEADGVTTVIEIVAAASPDATLLRLTDPLVTIGDIAAEAGVTRQAVRNWALGTRHSGFPRPLAIVGDGVRVWRQAEADAWLTSAVNLGSGHRFPTAAFVLSFNDALNQERDGASVDTEAWEIASEMVEVQTATVERPSRSPARARAAVMQ